MPSRRTRSPALRLGVPALFSEGRFEQVLIMTFGVDLEFYERVLRRHFGTFRNQVVLADGQQLDRTVASIADAGTLRHLNRSWLAGPIRLPHAAHAKLILLASSDSAVLLVGSGNLHMGGYAGAGECFTPYRWSVDEPADVIAFTAVRSLTDGLGDRGLLDAVTRERLKVFWNAYDWWHAEPVVDGPVRHNLDIPLGEQLLEAIGDDRVEELIVAAPFHDRKCAALDRLLNELKPRQVRVLIQSRHASVDPKRLAAVLGRHQGDVFSIEAAGDAVGTYLHTKMFIAKTKRRAVCLTGSANCSGVALWARHPDANIEIGNLAIGDRDAFDHLVDAEVVTISGPVDPTTLSVSFQEDAETEDDPVIRVENLRWEAPVVAGTVIASIDDPSRISITIDGRPADAAINLTIRSDGNTDVEARVSDAADILSLIHI